MFLVYTNLFIKCGLIFLKNGEPFLQKNSFWELEKWKMNMRILYFSREVDQKLFTPNHLVNCILNMA